MSAKLENEKKLIEDKLNINELVHKTISNAEYIVDEKKKTIICKVKSKGKTLVGVARCKDTDEFVVEIGMALASFRAELAQRRRDLHMTEDVIRDLKAIIEMKSYEYTLVGNSFYGGAFKQSNNVSKHWKRFLQEAVEERNVQLKNIMFCKLAIQKLSNI